ncbi:MAG: cob(I)yrinic acid a,c-diamide adenosyltransferase [Acidiferrobacterales bacterium]
MGHRLSRIYTRTGDDGTTGLGDGARVAKDCARVEALGAVDELNSMLGMLLTEPLSPAVSEALVRIQHTLFDLGGELSVAGSKIVQESRITELETLLDHWNSGLAPLKDFILPGGTRPAAICHLARSICRRAERRVYTLFRQETVSPVSLRYLNRLSDLLFVLARTLNQADGTDDVLWQPAKRENSDS